VEVGVTHLRTKLSLFLIFGLALWACGDETAEPDDGDACPAAGCACLTVADCPDPLVQTCSSTGVCVNRDSLQSDATDASDEPDATLDDPTIDPTTDPVPDSDPIEEVSDPDVETVEPDVDADGDSTSDPDIEMDPEVTPDEDAEDMATGYEVVWVAYAIRARSGWFSLAFIKSDGTGRVAYETDAVDVTSPAWSPDGTQLAFRVLEAGEPSFIRIIDFDGGDSQDIVSTVVNFSDLVWMPDGENLLFVGNKVGVGTPDPIWIVNTDSEVVTAVTEPTGGSSDNGPVPAPDGSLIYFVRGIGDDKEIWSINPDNGDEALISDAPGIIFGGLDISPDGSTLIWSGSGGSLRRHCLEGGRCGSGGAGNAPTFFPDGGRVAVSETGTDSDILILDAQNGGTLLNLTDDDATNTGPAVSSAAANTVDVSFDSD